MYTNVWVIRPRKLGNLDAFFFDWTPPDTPGTVGMMYDYRYHSILRDAVFQYFRVRFCDLLGSFAALVEPILLSA
jgi:hypothetical protein